MTRRYPAYRDSGVEWLGEVPEGWVVSKLSRAIDPRRQITYGIVQAGPHCEGGIPYIRPTDMTDESGVLDESTLMLTSPEIVAAYSRSEVRAGDLVCSIGPSFGKVMVVPESLSGANLTQGTARLAVTLANNHPRFVFWFLRSAIAVNQWESSIGGATFRSLNLEPLAATRLAIPPLPEQTAIAAFLDQETAKIDALVAEQRRLIDLLREKRQAVISHAVTKGLNPNTTLKPSGVEWLGDVPEGWGFKRLSLVCSFEQGKAHEPYFDEDGDFICVTARFVSTSGEKFKRCSANLTPAAVGDILMVMSDLPNGRALARAFLVDRPNVYAVNQRVCRITTSRDGDARYFAYQLNRHTSLLSEDDGFNQTHLSNASFTKLMLVVPPADEQKRIADYLDAKTSSFDTLTATAESAIALLQERRAALISAAVTGKIDVRDLATNHTEAA